MGRYIDRQIDKEADRQMDRQKMMPLKLGTPLIKLNETVGDNLIPSRNKQSYSAG